MKTILLCSDLDRTLIPNGSQSESPQARPALLKLADHPNLRLAYVSGRDQALVRNAIGKYDLPQPDFIIGDVGTTLYHFDSGQWQLDQSWQQQLGREWHGTDRDKIAALLVENKNSLLTLQSAAKQSAFKVSFYTDISLDPLKLKEDIIGILNKHDIAAHLIWSRDEAEHTGLLDILPPGAGKLQAIRFLMTTTGTAENRVVFAGDSGNDLDVLTSGLASILVKNAADDVRQQALDLLSKCRSEDRLYLAGGDFMGMNGNYAAGVIEGLVHFFPETIDWVSCALKAQ